MILLTAGRDAEAVDVLERAVTAGADPATLPLVIALARHRGPDAARPLCLKLLERNPDHAMALDVLSRQLLEAGDADVLARLCGSLSARGAQGVQLAASWTAARARLGERPDHSDLQVGQLGLDRDFRQRLTRGILGHPNRIAPGRHIAMQGGSRINNPLIRGAECFSTLVSALRGAVEGYAEALGPLSPVSSRGPVRLNVWSIILGGADFEGWHMHPAGLLSGVYYVRLPDVGPTGTLEFGVLHDVDPAWRRKVVPEEDLCVLFPSAYVHRTVPTGVDQPRISVAFDVVPA